MTIRSYDQISSDFFRWLPLDAEFRALTDDQLLMLKNLANLLDNTRYMERERRDDERKAAEVKS
jgi:hypothetical protein